MKTKEKTYGYNNSRLGCNLIRDISVHLDSGRIASKVRYRLETGAEATGSKKRHGRQ